MFRPFLVLAVCYVVLCVAQTDTEEDMECGPNEVLNRCAPCPPEDTCEDNEQYICLRSLFFCTAACLCKEGFIRNATYDECIPEKECVRRCGKNEQYTECKQMCTNETCATIGRQLTCYANRDCVPGCSCKFGYFREDVEDVANPGCVLPQCSCPQMKDKSYCQPNILG